MSEAILAHRGGPRAVALAAPVFCDTAVPAQMLVDDIRLYQLEPS